MVRHGWLLMLALLAVTLSVTSAVHAREALDSATVSCGGETHADGDRDAVPGDADQSVPHHHTNCHGHAVALGVEAAASMECLRRAGCALALHAPNLTPFLADPARRPPRA